MNKATAPATPPAPAAAKPAGKKVFVRTLQGEMVHLFTSVRFTTEPKRHELDQFVQTQLDAGKLVLESLDD